MADHNANKITVRVQVEPTPVATETNNQQPAVSAKARPDARGTQPEGAAPDAVASGPPTPPKAADNNEGLPRGALAELEQIELDDGLLDLVPAEVDNFEGINLDFAATLLEDGGEEIAQHIAETYNPEAEKVAPGQDYPELDLGVNGLTLGDSDSDSEEPPKKEEAPTKTLKPTTTPAGKTTSTLDDVEMEEKGEPLHEQPGLRIEERKIKIKDIGLFRRRTGQPVWLRAYPWVKHPAIPSIPGKPQVYTGQDHHDPTGLYPRSTHKERQQTWETERQALSQDIDNPTYNHGQALEYQRYEGETLVQRRDQPWPWAAETEDDYYSLERRDIAVMGAIHESGMMPHVQSRHPQLSDGDVRPGQSPSDIPGSHGHRHGLPLCPRPPTGTPKREDPHQ